MNRHAFCISIYNKVFKFRKWFKYGLKAQKFQKQHALKGQKPLAQGIALGIIAISKAPCKGKSFKTPGNNIKLLPLQVGCSKLESKIRYKKGVISVQLSY